MYLSSVDSAGQLLDDGLNFILYTAVRSPFGARQLLESGLSSTGKRTSISLVFSVTRRRTENHHDSNSGTAFSIYRLSITRPTRTENHEMRRVKDSCKVATARLLLTFRIESASSSRCPVRHNIGLKDMS